MKKSKKILVGAALLASAAVLGGCTDEVQELYGPPPTQNIEEPADEKNISTEQYEDITISSSDTKTP